jgi:hypothetical protein
MNNKIQIGIVFVVIIMIIIGATIYFLPTSESNSSSINGMSNFQFSFQENVTDGSKGESINPPSISGTQIHEEFQAELTNVYIIYFGLVAQYLNGFGRNRGEPEMTVTPPPDLTEYEFEEIVEDYVDAKVIWHIYTIELDISADENLTITANSTNDAYQKFNDSFVDDSAIGTWNVDAYLPGYYYNIYLIMYGFSYLEIADIVEVPEV